jgi:CheY-like chemotaxis protein
MRGNVTDLRDYSADWGFNKNWPARIIIADDNQRLRSRLAEHLRDKGHEVLEARDGVELLELVSSEIVYPRGGVGVDLIVSDMQMPNADGLWVLASLRLLDWATPFILLSARIDEELVHEAQRLGATAVLRKPLSFRRLAELVQDLAGSTSEAPRAAAAG